MITGAVNYETLRRVSEAISSAQELDDVSQQIVHSLQQALNLKGCALLLWDRKSDELIIAAASGLSQRYLKKGPISARKSIAASLRDGPVAIYDVEDDPRLQYPLEAKVEGISSILSVPVILRGRPLGVLRLYTAEPWEFSEQDIIFGQAVAEIVALVLDNVRLYKGMKSSIEALKVMRGPTRPYKRTLPE
ncbi:MAG: GAF domain-containing protein [Proteobacteria bacterium]|nr:GAF domain-containing protein [Pseudomonadota bacterium]